jgi:hypothetical protein
VGKAFTLQVTMFIKPELRDEYLPAQREFLVLATGAGLHLPVRKRSGRRTRNVIVFECWRGPDEFNGMLQRDYARRYMKLGKSAHAAPRVVVRLDPIEPLDQ